MPTVPNLETPNVQEEALPGRPIPRVDDQVSPAAFGSGLAAGIEDAGEAGASVQAEQKRQNDQLRVIDANTQLEAARNALLYGKADPQTGQMTGGAYSFRGTDAINLPGKMIPAYQQIAQGISSKLTPDQQKLFQTHVAAGQNDLNLQLNRYEYEESNRLADQTYTTAASQAVENASVGWRDPMQAGKSRADIKALVSMQGDREGWNQSQKDAQAQKLLAQMHFSVVDRMLADGNPSAALSYFVGTKSQPGIRDSNELTGEQAHQLGAAIDTALKQQGAEQSAAVAAKVRDVRAAAINGQMIPPSSMPSDNELRSAYQDTWQQMKDGINRDVTMGADLKSFATLTPAELAAHVSTYKPTSVLGAAEGYDRFNAASEAAQRSMADRAKDPRQFAIDNKLGSNTIDFSDPKAMGQEINARLASLPQLSTQMGGYVPPLSKAEASQLSQSLERQTPADRLRSLATLSTSIGDDKGFQEVMRQVLPGSPVTAIVGSQVSASQPVKPPVWFDGRFASNPSDQTHILHGEQLLNPKEGPEGKAVKAFPMPPDGGVAGLREQFSSATGDVFRGRPDLGEAYFSAFKSAYASLLSEKGDMSGVGNSKLRDQAMTIAIGNLTKFHGDQVSVPTGMDPSRFESIFDRAVSARATQLGAPADWADRIDGYKAREVGGLGSGRYQLMNGNMPLLRPDGKGTFEVDLHDQFTAGPQHQVQPVGSPQDQTRAAAAHPAAPAVGPVNTDQAGIPRSGVPRETKEHAPPLNLPGGRGARGHARPSQGEAPDL